MHIFMTHVKCEKPSNQRCLPAMHIYTCERCTWYEERNRSLLYVVKMCDAASVIVKVSWKGLESESYCLNIESDKQKKQPLWEKLHGHNVSKSTSSFYKCNHLVLALTGTVKHNIPLREYLSRLSASWESGYSRTSHSNTMPIHGSLPPTLLCHAKWCHLPFQVLRICLYTVGFRGFIKCKWGGGGGGAFLKKARINLPCDLSFLI